MSIATNCSYWLSNPGMVWGVFGWWVPMRTAFRVPTTIPGIPATLNLIQALSNTSIDGLGALYREGTAALLNSIVNYRFPFTTVQVQRSFVSALGSNGAASSQAQLFKLANEGRLKPRANWRETDRHCLSGYYRLSEQYVLVFLWWLSYP